jgi:putative DNA primase/helicase
MNAMPRLADTTDGIFRRLAFIPFRRRFSPGTEGYDPHMAEKMSQPENLRRLALLGLMELPQLVQRGAFTIIPDMAEEVEAIRMENDVVRRWLYEEMMSDTDLDGRWTDDVYREFARWCDDAGEKYGASQAAFTKKLLVTLVTLEVVSAQDRTIGKRGRKFKLR